MPADRTVRALLILLSVLIAVAGGVQLATWLYGRGKIAALSNPPSPLFRTDNARVLAAGEAVALVVIGDSRAAQWRPPPPVAGGQTLIRGVGGETSAQTLARLADDALALRPRAVLLVTGINDLVAASYLAEAAARDVALALVERLLAAARQIEEQGACALIATVIPPARPDLLRRLAWQPSVADLVIMVNRELRARAADRFRILAAEEFSNPDDSLYLSQRWSSDALHLNSDGYAILARELGKIMDKESQCLLKGRRF